MPHFPMNTGTLFQRTAMMNLKEQTAGDQQPQPSQSQTDKPAENAPASVQVKNRRKRYLDAHPEYFGPDLEMAGVEFSFKMFSVETAC